MSPSKKVDAGPSLFDTIEIVAETLIDVQRRERAAEIRKRAARGQGPLPRTGERSLSREIEREIEVLGFRLHRHPALEHVLLANRINATPIAALKRGQEDGSAVILALVESVATVQQRRPADVGPDGVEMVVSDQTGRTRIYGLTPDGMPEENTIVVMRIETRRTGKIMKSWELPTVADEKAPAAVVVSVSPDYDGDVDELTNGIKTAIRDFGRFPTGVDPATRRGEEHRLILYFSNGDGTGSEIRTVLTRVNATPELESALRAIRGVADVQVKKPAATGTALGNGPAIAEKAGHDTLF